MSFELDLNSRAGIKFKRVMKVGMIIGAMAGVIVMLIITGIVSVIKNNRHEKEVAKLETEITELKKSNPAPAFIEDAAKQLQSEEDDWCLALINAEYPMDVTYEPELVTLEEEMKVDARILEDAKEMLAAAREEGLSPYVVSAYRSVDEQSQIFDSTMYTHLNTGMSMVEAYDETRLSVALPGCSEHATGLALDIVSSSYTNLDESQAETEEAKWLAEHCWEYGFILRYPPEKSDITGIIYEPWHYRYVGKDTAKEITEMGVTFEEYLGVK
ncbi:MAG: M15 family metallopeptidase [Ruminococcus sp.]|nr:M15 family metallopeptidase [Ruminococcus sp.]